MTRRLLRTIVVTVTVTESWTLIWREGQQEETGAVRQRQRSHRRRSQTSALVAGQVDGVASDDEQRGSSPSA